MKLIEIERVCQSPTDGKLIPVDAELYVNPHMIQSVSMEKSVVFDSYIYEARMRDGTTYFISRKCYDNILRWNAHDPQV